MIGIGIIGSGVGIRTHAPGFKLTNRAKIIGFFSPNEQKCKNLLEEHSIGRYFKNYKDLCKDPNIDLVVIASPNKFHVEQTIYALNQGKHVLCEKPLALTSDECDKLINEENKFKNLFSAVNHQLRFNPYIKTIRDITQSNELGKPYNVQILHQGMAFANPSFPWSWSFDTESGGGVRWAMGSHLVDLIHYIFNKEITSVFGGMHTVIPIRKRGQEEIKVNASAEFSGSAILEDGVNVYLSSTASAFSGNKFKISIFFEKGEIEFDLDTKLKVYKSNNSDTKVMKNLSSVYQNEIDNEVSIFSSSFRYFASQIVEAFDNNDLKLLTDAATFSEAKKTTKVLEAFYKSYKDGKSVKLIEKTYDSNSY